MKRNFLIILIIVLLSGMLGGCCCCCYPIQEWAVTEILTKWLCDFLEDYFRDFTPSAFPRDMKKGVYGFASLEDTQKAIDNVWGEKDFVTKFLLQPGCENLLMAVAKYADGTEKYITAVVNEDILFNDISFYEISSEGLLVGPLGPDPEIESIIAN